jgi:hypothetical protein
MQHIVHRRTIFGHDGLGQALAALNETKMWGLHSSQDDEWR